MNSITCDDLDFEEIGDAKKFIEKNHIRLFIDEGDVILCYESTSEDLESNWEKISMKTALYFQSNLIDEVLARNLILVFLTKNEVDISVKKRIQSDTYCCRKIVRSNVISIENSIKDLMLFNIEGQNTAEVESLIDLIKIEHPEVFQLIDSENYV
ncbi:hypothetical protein GA076_18890 [Vibrio parahaemolyticus]|uniref:ABC-three component system middle component 1 n=1 Tax=Vibrio harveyi group TaxID=717610 RepID=UPI000E325C16|nr:MULTISPECIES: ABC-three component system middle component 1 [Vibrio harveyi group]EGU9030329.1 hypothetical protein [Vibrio parahaemolyticus]EHJ9976987.1 hypothetical protein [Vibrio parahaemolyticus]MCS0415443.1 hypothetical protein [Vibrio diabolicus]RFD37668.1 hypothetical protein BS586_19615 [Vibrio parahaemolyticus]TBT37003.1 hypothetical protein D5E85_03790 [Vibrio parahaemolyticus]